MIYFDVRLKFKNINGEFNQLVLFSFKWVIAAIVNHIARSIPFEFILNVHENWRHNPTILNYQTKELKLKEKLDSKVELKKERSKQISLPRIQKDVGKKSCCRRILRELDALKEIKSKFWFLVIKVKREMNKEKKIVYSVILKLTPVSTSKTTRKKIYNIIKDSI